MPYLCAAGASQKQVQGAPSFPCSTDSQHFSPANAALEAEGAAAAARGAVAVGAATTVGARAVRKAEPESEGPSL